MESMYDILFESLSACSLEVVDKSKLISKYFNQLPYEHAFIQSHRKKTGTIYGYILQSLDDYNVDYKFVSDDDSTSTTSTLNLDFLPSNSRILASSDQGLLCYSARLQKIGRIKFFVCKPTTGQTEMLPYPVDFTRFMALAVLQSDPLRYKIVGFSEQENNYSCQIFDSKTWSWKPLAIELPIPLSIRRKSVLACGRFHWLLSNNQVLVFHLEKETCTFLTLPQLDKENYSGEINMQLVKYKGKIGLICQDLTSFEIWVMQDYKNQDWNMIKKINMESLKKKARCSVLQVVNLYASNIALIKGREFVFYNLEDSSVNVAKLNHRVTHSYEVLPFRSDLEPVDLRGIKRRKPEVSNQSSNQELQWKKKRMRSNVQIRMQRKPTGAGVHFDENDGNTCYSSNSTNSSTIRISNSQPVTGS